MFLGAGQDCPAYNREHLVFYFDNGLRLADADLALDVRRRQTCGFISHAHADHVGRHELTLCTQATAALLEARWGQRVTRCLQYGEPCELGRCRLTAFPAGHVLGSAMLLVECQNQRLLYTGDFRLGPSATAEPIELPRADILVMECTFGHPTYRFPARARVEMELVGCVRRTLQAGLTPVIFAYSLGKAQEVISVLDMARIPVVQHPQVLAISRVYERLGINLGPLNDLNSPGAISSAWILPPRNSRGTSTVLPVRRIEISVSGWAIDPRMRRRLGGHYQLPLSDHADFDELLRCIERVQPKTVYCWHGQRAFVDHLRRSGV
jgi:Cft2 family RNA processing exonuclease